MPFNLSDIGGILVLAGLVLGFMVLFSNGLSFLPVLIIGLLAFAAFSCAAVDNINKE